MRRSRSRRGDFKFTSDRGELLPKFYGHGNSRLLALALAAPFRFTGEHDLIVPWSGLGRLDQLRLAIDAGLQFAWGQKPRWIDRDKGVTNPERITPRAIHRQFGRHRATT